jgi:putative transposase
MSANRRAATARPEGACRGAACRARFPIATMARVLGVSKAGYYAWRHRPPSTRARADTALLERICAVHAASRQIYGAPRVHAALRDGGGRHSRKLGVSAQRKSPEVERLMREVGLVGASHHRGGPKTTRRDQDARPAPDLVDRDFTASGPNQLWVSDITFIPSAAGFLYLTVVLDAWSRKVVGWALQAALRR